MFLADHYRCNPTGRINRDDVWICAVFLPFQVTIRRFQIGREATIAPVAVFRARGDRNMLDQPADHMAHDRVPGLMVRVGKHVPDLEWLHFLPAHWLFLSDLPV